MDDLVEVDLGGDIVRFDGAVVEIFGHVGADLSSNRYLAPHAQVTAGMRRNVWLFEHRKPLGGTTTSIRVDDANQPAWDRLLVALAGVGVVVHPR